MGEKVGESVPDAVDYKGDIADRSKTGGWVAAALSLGIEVIERLTTMGIGVNLVTYLEGTMHLASATSAKIVSNFMGTSYLLCLLGGFLADTFLGRYKTIVIFAFVQTLGTGMLAVSTKLPQLRPPPCDSFTSSSCTQASGAQMGILYISLYLVALGTGGLKSSVSGFGTDQFDEKNTKEKTRMEYFFHRFFFVISIGTLMAVTVLVYVQDKVSRSWGYGLCSISMVVAIIVFLSGTTKYRYKKRTGSPIIDIWQVVVAATRKKDVEKPSSTASLYEDSPEDSRIRHTNQFCFLDKASVLTKDDYGSDGALAPNPWKLCRVTRVEEVKMMIRLLPFWATTIIFWTTFAQMMTFSVDQASTMRRSLGDFEIPAGSLTFFFVSATLIALLVYDRVVVPLWKRWKKKPGFTNLQRVGLGLFFSAIGMAAAAGVEVKRLSVAKSSDPLTRTLPITVYLLIPQFFFVGAGEAFLYTGQLDFFITQSPKSMKTMSTGLFLTTLALGFFFSSVLVSIVKDVTSSQGREGWVGRNINEGRLDLFYALVATLSFVNFGLFVLCTKWYKRKRGKYVAKEQSPVEEKC